jgi:hypothetical protein
VNIFTYYYVLFGSNKEVKQSLYRPGQALQEVRAPRISRQSAHEGGNVVSRMHQLLLPPKEIILVLISVRV